MKFSFHVYQIAYVPVLKKSLSSQTAESMEKSYLVGLETQHSLQRISSQFSEALRLEPHNQTVEIKVCFLCATACFYCKFMCVDLVFGFFELSRTVGCTNFFYTSMICKIGAFLKCCFAHLHMNVENFC